MRALIKLIIVILIIFGAVFGYQIMKSNKQPATIFTIEKGESTKIIAKNLQESRLIGSVWTFRLYAKLTGAENKFVAGNHQLEANLNISNLIKSLETEKNISKEKNITFIEGWNNREIAKYLSDKGIVSKDEFLAATNLDKWKSQYDFLSGVKAQTLEGFIFPDTYRIFSDASSEDIIKKALDNFDKKLTSEMRSDIKSKSLDLPQVLTMASIVEGEANNEKDMKLIADVFSKRIAKGIALQSDATVNYVTGKGLTRPTAADLAIDSPYNTYKYRGLPPGPIDNPGLTAIKAVIYPTPNEYYYFIHTKEGKAVYAKTYDEHLANVAKYLDK